MKIVYRILEAINYVIIKRKLELKYANIVFAQMYYAPIQKVQNLSSVFISFYKTAHCRQIQKELIRLRKLIQMLKCYGYLLVAKQKKDKPTMDIKLTIIPD
ncbi:hypothetical protein TTHERM_000483429 (macronuclear) [Tetrahymena thermophila SB210]|uniref:Uncharacterized protein n=1 Tax=Tetrahymena thermophila (strain SB210) TaxID=312017 RepID=W7XHV2_TETTS|nr:hypothetical protein TTHERM_000483429 [Tetrahymena thermophila SB210]EWS74076.1 hypothetical protein TTHERM_000483429 [Tetrahymena thermophila SB210]|eukprot:XP_012653409.1 hypothetical protein TTHERM_000483429 [Tetrahymena thermophila SB210]